MREIPTRALSILQPWAHAIVHLGKTIENRDWRGGCSFRGEILIHASKGVGSLDAFDAAVRFIGETAAWPSPQTYRVADVDRRGRWRPHADGPFGGIVGRARIVGEVFVDTTGSPRVCDGPERGVETRGLTEGERAWWTGGFALVLADVEPLPFVACAGALGLWTVPENVRAAIAAEVPRG